jgi:quinol monooxygenase YgiN
MMAQWSGISFEHTVVGVVSFKVRPNELDGWRAQWEDIGRQAEATEGCQFFRLAENTREDNGYAIITAWNPGNTWLSFVQSVPALKDMEGGVWGSPFSFYVLMEEGKPLPW